MCNLCLFVISYAFYYYAIMKCGTVFIMQAVYCLIGSAKQKFIVNLSTKYRWLVNLLPLVGEKLFENRPEVVGRTPDYISSGQGGF